MTTGLNVAIAALGLVIGWLLWIAVERVPDRRTLRTRPFPELSDVVRQPLGIAVVLMTGALFAGIAAVLEDVWELPAFLVLAAALVLLSAIDLRHFILPNRIVYPLTVVVLVLLAAAAAANSDVDPFLRSLACGAGGFLAFTTLHLISPRSMGFGDVKLSFVLGLALGWLGVGETIVGLFFGFVYGAVVGLLLIITRIRTRKDHVPFGPFLAAGAMTAVLIGDVIVDWYRG
jgi:leader peptidase (prepilin peptidase) / N-methyltransferase